MDFDMDVVQWGVVVSLWFLVSAGIWKIWAKSEVMGSVVYRLIAIVAMFFIITFIVNFMGD